MSAVRTPGVGEKASSSLVMFIGATLVFVGILLLTRRYSLRRLLCGVLAVAMTGCIPYVIPVSSPRTPKALLSIGFDSDLLPLQVKAISDELQPENALNTLPRQMLAELGLNANLCLKSVAVSKGAEDGMPGLQLKMEFATDLTEKQREELFEFFGDYFHLLATEAASQQGLVKKPSFDNFFTEGGVWENWKAEWKLQHDQRAHE